MWKKPAKSNTLKHETKGSVIKGNEMWKKPAKSNTLKHETKGSVKVLLCLTLPDIRQGIACLKTPRFRPLVLLLRAA